MPHLLGSRVAIHCIGVVVCVKMQPRSPPVAVSPRGEPRLDSSLLSFDFALKPPSVYISQCVASRPVGAPPVDNKVSTYHHDASDQHALIQSHGPPNTSLVACFTQTPFPDVSSASIACFQSFEAMLDKMTDRLRKGSGYHRSPKQNPPKNIPKDTHQNLGSRKEEVMATPTST